jgi:hypothetical protein
MRSSPDRRPRLERCAIASALLLLLPLVAACDAEPPAQPVSFNEGLLHIKLADTWVKMQDQGTSMKFRLPGSEGITLSFEDKSSSFGMPLTTPAVKSMIGSELNRAFGQVKARLTLKGSALLTYPREKREGREQVYTHNWVLAKPYGSGIIMRVDITLRVPVSQKDALEIRELIAVLDKQVGNGVLGSNT